MKIYTYLLLVLLCTGSSRVIFAQRTSFNYDFAPAETWVKLPERPWRDDICLNGSWKFLPVANAGTIGKEQLLHPGLPVDAAWESVPVKVPSPWNVNGFAKGNGGDFLSYPSYPAHWDKVKAGWLMRSIPFPAGFKDKRLVLHFEAIAGYAQVFVNRKKVGESQDPFLPLDIDITGALNPAGDNELLVWIADLDLFNVPGKYGTRTYVAGSFWGQHALGIWQDVYLLAKPTVHIQDVFIQPSTDRGELAITATLTNETGKPIDVFLGGSIRPWINQAGPSEIEQPEVKWSLGNEVLAMPRTTIRLQPHATTSVDVKLTPGNQLQYWTPETPHLYGLVLSIAHKKQVIDQQYERFGWRQFAIVDRQLRLNGQPIVLKGDSWHFMGIPQMTRRYAWAWYRTLKECHANAVRLHAQPYPRFYLDMADEMGIMVLDETGIWASDGGPKADSDEYWTNCEAHLRNLVRRDRNHPSVFGWSVCNENLPVVMHVQRAPETVIKRQVAEINKWVAICRQLDPTRNWISGDGETNLPTDLPTVLGHYGHDNEMRNWSSQGKLWGIGEQGMAYSGTPREAAKFSGNRAYASQWGRMEGVAEEALQLLNLQKKHKASFMSVFNIAWYGLQPLALGMRDTTKAPQPQDGVFFAPFREGKPGVQPERLGPYTTTFNPGYDPALPLFRTWPLYDAVKASFATGDPLAETPAPKENIFDTSKALPVLSSVVLSSNDPDSVLSHILQDMGVALKKTINKKEKALLIIDGKYPRADKNLQQRVLQNGGTVLIWGLAPAAIDTLNTLLPQPITLTERKATSFITTNSSPLLNGLGNAGFYFTEMARTPVMQYGFTGTLVNNSSVLLEACNTDWKTWNHQPESIKTAAVIRSEREAKPAGTACIETNAGNGKLYVLALEPAAMVQASITTVRRLLLNLGITFTAARSKDMPAFTADGILQQALVLGAFEGKGKTVAEMAQTELLKGNTGGYFAGNAIGNRFWELGTAPDGVFDFKRMGLNGPTDNAIAFVSFWIYSPRSLTDLLVAPDMPVLNMHIGADDAWQLYLDHQLVKASIKEGGLKRKEQTIPALPLKKGWNHFVIKVIQRSGDWKLAVELDCDKKDFLKEIRSQVSIAP